MYPIYKIKLHNPTMHKPQSDTRTCQRKEIETGSINLFPDYTFQYTNCPIF